MVICIITLIPSSFSSAPSSVLQMIIDALVPAADMSSSKILQHNATRAPSVIDSPPAYSDIHGPYNGQGSGVRREQSYRISPMNARRERPRRHRHNRSRDHGNGNAGDYDNEPSQNYNHGHRHDHRHYHDGEREWAPAPAHKPPPVDFQSKTQLPEIPGEEEASPSSEHGPQTVIPMPTADQIHISDHRHEIKGTFYVDPLIESLDPSRRKKKSKDVPPHASFRTRNQEIDIELATTGNVEKVSKAKVAVSSAAGQIKVKLLAMHPSRPRLELAAQSRHGDIVVFIPDNYVGVIQLSTRKGRLQVLPALASHMKIVKSSEHDMLFMVGDAHEGVDTSREASFCDLSSRTGSVIIGLSNRDTYAPRPGFWKRMGSLLKGESACPEAR